MTYTTLTSDLQAYLENSETSFVARIPDFVQQAEARAYNSVRTPDQRQTFSASVATQLLATPSGFLEPLALYITVAGSLVPLLLKTSSFIQTVFPSGTGQPGYYAIRSASNVATSLMLGPTPDIAYTYSLDYFGNPASIVSSATTWLGDHFPEVLLYGSLLEGYVYMKGEKDMRDVFQERFDRGMEMLRRSTEVLALQDEYRTSPVAA